MIIRIEHPDDAPAIADLVRRAFLTAAHSCGREAEVVDELRRDRALMVSLVAEDASGLVGHLAASPATIAGKGGWAGLGPLAVAPESQRRGIGSALMAEGLARLRRDGLAGAVLVGDPAYYLRFGFAARKGLTLAGVPPEVVLALAFGSEASWGEAVFHPALSPA